ncbi:hypothetical protein DOM21_17545 [Bacteriovorax stolpii]|uniref:YcaO-like family protein n=1 Tax=Bacteriovorax stolpii TaxID=960 RepID=UPI00115B8D11|nr:YcaO-like family protein [Bacteriovorax stolpii]QDK43227.1 hypothetical protein DOM21_17545 [Bacteriovorax stolpii]
MENQNKKLIQWSLNEFKSSIKFFEQRWNIFEKQPYFDYKTEITIDQLTFHGRGVSPTKEQALSSSIGEALERYSMKANNISSSNGIALHFTTEKSQKNAKLELIERHFVMLYTLGQIPKIKIDKALYPTNINKVISNLNELKINVTFLNLNNSHGLQTTLCEVSGLGHKSPFGLFFGSSASYSFTDTLEKSFTEAITNVAAYFNHNIISITEEEFKKIKSPTPNDHLSLYSNIAFSQKYLAQAIHINTNESLIFDNSSVHFEEIKYKYSYILPVYKAFHRNALEAKWGLLEDQISIFRNLNPEFPLVLP